jgi:hypothetical protein
MFLRDDIMVNGEAWTVLKCLWPEASFANFWGACTRYFNYYSFLMCAMFELGAFGPSVEEALATRRPQVLRRLNDDVVIPNVFCFVCDAPGPSGPYKNRDVEIDFRLIM